MPRVLTAEEVEYAALSVAGQVRRHNEDALLCRADLGLWAVADGMGGHQRGDLASQLALDALAEAVISGADLVAAVRQANQHLLDQVKQAPELEGMGTTLVAVRLVEGAAELAWVGDSRAYRVARSGIEQLSHDHSWVQQMIDAGQLSPAEARTHPQRNVILQCLGRDTDSLQVAYRRCSVAPGELLLLCSDGLTGELTDAQILQACVQAGTLTSLVENLIAQANAQGGRDNISCLVLTPLQGQFNEQSKPQGLAVLTRAVKRLISKR